MPTTSSVGLTGNQDIDGVLSGVKWTDPHITFSFPTLLAQYGYTETGFEAMNATQQSAVRAIMHMYESYTGLVLTEVTETTTTHGTIRFAEEDNAGTAYGYYPSAGEWGGDVWLNHTNYNTPLKGTYAYATFMHEIGHTMGLDHGQDGLAALPTNHDSLEYSVMTYRSYVGADLNGYTVSPGSYPQSLMMDDIAALQTMYGANYTTNATASIYSWSPTTGEMFINGVGQGASTANKIFLTVWDGGGVDTYDFSNYTTNLTVNLAPGAWSTTNTSQLAVLGFSGQMARGNIANANLFGGNTASLIENANGGSGNDIITGNQGNNVLDGGGGNDTLTGGLGNDTIIGGTGVDYCIIGANYVSCTVTYDSSTSIFSIQSLVDGLDYVSGVEFFTFADQTLAASALIGPDLTAPVLLSATPADGSTGVARGANIVLSFSETVLAGSGNIVIHNSDGTTAASIAVTDSSQVSISGGVVTINPLADLLASHSYYVTVDTHVFRDSAGNYYGGISSVDTLNFVTASSVINGTANANTLTGTADADTINGLGGNDTLNGLGGDDTLDGGTGSDTMNGGLGNDSYIVDNTGDRVVESAGAGTDTVSSSVSFTLGANIENLVLTGSGATTGSGNGLDNAITGNAMNNSLSGAGGNDTLMGLGGADTLSGGDGNDTLFGGLGNDTLAGGGGQDFFVFDTTLGSGNIDRITDFNVVNDTITLDVSVFMSLTPGNLGAAAFSTSSVALDASDRIIYNAATGALYYDPDGVGGIAQQQFATITPKLALTSADFLLVV